MWPLVSCRCFSKPCLSCGFVALSIMLGKRFLDLLLGIVDVPQRVHEEIVQRFDVLRKKAHGSGPSCFVDWEMQGPVEPAALPAGASRSGARTCGACARFPAENDPAWRKQNSVRNRARKQEFRRGGIARNNCGAKGTGGGMLRSGAQTPRIKRISATNRGKSWPKINIAFTDYSRLSAMMTSQSEGTSEGQGQGQ